MKSKPAEPFDPKEPTIGDFTLEGAWNPKRPTPPKSDPMQSLYYFVAMLVTKRRREPWVPPTVFAARIATSRFHDAFPHAADWVACSAWWQVPTLTSAEATVKYGGFHQADPDAKPPHSLFDREAAQRSDLPTSSRVGGTTT